ncbi:MAG TPA: hypothetical protein VK454_06445, partial [Myxococcaceae bacterium]|nr:hypothetical protein [Myxococcaceae bacterium]
MPAGRLTLFVLGIGLGLAGQARSAEKTLAIVGATVVPSPTGRPLPNGAVLVQDGRVVAVGPAANVLVPDGAERIDGRGMTLLAGFWNCHVHLVGEEFQGAVSAPRERLSGALERMFSRYGTVAVVDAGSFLADTVALRERIERGEFPGPRILTAGEGIYPKGAIPIYLRQSLPPEVVERLAQPATPAEARADVDRNLAGGADATKLFTGTWLGGAQTGLMPVDIVRAASEATHRAGKPV